MSIAYRREDPSLANGIRCCASWLYFDAAVAMIERQLDVGMASVGSGARCDYDLRYRETGTCDRAAAMPD